MSAVVVLDKIKAPNKNERLEEDIKQEPSLAGSAFTDESVQIDVKVEVRESDNLNADEHSSEIIYATIDTGHNAMENFQSSTSVKCEVNSVNANDVEVSEVSTIIGRQSLRSRTTRNQNKIILIKASSQENSKDEEYKRPASSLEDESDCESEAPDESNQEDDLEQVDEKNKNEDSDDEKSTTKPRKTRRKKACLQRNSKTYPCTMCGKSYNDNYNLKRHLTVVHKTCPGEVVPSEPSPLDNANENVSLEEFFGPKLQFQCWKCPNSYALKGSLRVHLMQQHKFYGKICFSCLEIFKTRQELNEHKKSAHGERAPTGWRKDELKCCLCGVKFEGRASFRKRHMFIKHGIFVEEPTIHCSHCDLVFNDSTLLMQHKLKFHSVGSKEDGTQCEMCLKFLSSKNYLELHKVNVHTVNGQLVEIYKCGLCRDALEYLTGEGLADHENSEEHKLEVSKRVSVYCNACRKSFNGDVKALKNHLGRDEHTKELETLGEFERNRFCVPCRQNFETFEELVEHEKTGVGHRNLCSEFRMNQTSEEAPLEVPLICHACPKSFDHQSVLDSHLAKCHPPAGHVCKVRVLPNLTLCKLR